jgi:hypothetical protein
VKAERLDQFFRAAFGQEVTPFDYQATLAGGKDGTACESQFINVPTGYGKTATLVLASMSRPGNFSFCDRLDG